MAGDDLSRFISRMIWIVMNASERIVEDAHRFFKGYEMLCEIRGCFVVIPVEPTGFIDANLSRTSATHFPRNATAPNRR